MPDLGDLIGPQPQDDVLREQVMAQSDRSMLLDVLTADSICPVCGYKGTPISDEDGIAYRHDGRHFLCRVTPKVLEQQLP